MNGYTKSKKAIIEICKSEAKPFIIIKNSYNFFTWNG